MSFNFTASLAKAQEKNTTQDLLGAIILAPSGFGKSSLCTSIGVKNLYLYLRSENHGYKTAGLHEDADIIPICIDQDDEGKVLNPGQAYAKLISVLSSPDEIKAAGIKAVTLDSLSELETLIKATPMFINKVGTNSFAKTDVLIDMMKEVILKLQDLQTQIGVHYMCTCPLDVKELDKETGEIVEAAIKLVSYRAGEAAVALFPDVLTVGPVSNGAETKFRIQFMSSMTKVQKDQQGAIKRSYNFRPRVTSVDLSKVLPEYGHIKADLKEIIKMKLGTFQA